MFFINYQIFSAPRSTIQDSTVLIANILSARNRAMPGKYSVFT